MSCTVKAFKYVRDPKAFEVIADPTRRKIIYLLRAKEQTVSQIAESLGKTPQAIYHQIRKLLDAELVEVAREARVGHFIETYYVATAEVFGFQYGHTDQHESERELREGLEALAKVGIRIRPEKGLVEKAVEIELRLSSTGLPKALEEKISSLEDVGFMTKQNLYKLSQMVTMTDDQFEAMLQDERSLRRLLASKLNQDRPGGNPKVQSRNQ